MMLFQLSTVQDKLLFITKLIVVVGVHHLITKLIVACGVYHLIVSSQALVVNRGRCLSHCCNTTNIGIAVCSVTSCVSGRSGRYVFIAVCGKVLLYWFTGSGICWIIPWMWPFITGLVAFLKTYVKIRELCTSFEVNMCQLACE